MGYNQTELNTKTDEYFVEGDLFLRLGEQDVPGRRKSCISWIRGSNNK